jgi:hypothetical protein
MQALGANPFASDASDTSGVSVDPFGLAGYCGDDIERICETVYLGDDKQFEKMPIECRIPASTLSQERLVLCPSSPHDLVRQHLLKVNACVEPCSGVLRTLTLMMTRLRTSSSFSETYMLLVNPNRQMARLSLRL